MNYIYNEKEFLLPDSPTSSALYHAKIQEDGEYFFRIHDCLGGVRLHGHLHDADQIYEAVNKSLALADALIKFAEFINQMRDKRPLEHQKNTARDRP